MPRQNRKAGKKMGAPRKPAAKKLDETIRVRVTASVRKAMERAAEAKGLNVSAWLRSVGIEALHAAET